MLSRSRWRGHEALRLADVGAEVHGATVSLDNLEGVSMGRVVCASAGEGGGGVTPGSSDSPKRTVRVTRRRGTTTSGPDDRERADSSQRDRQPSGHPPAADQGPPSATPPPQEGQQPPAGSQGYWGRPPSGGAGAPMAIPGGGFAMGLVGLLVLAVACAGVYFVFLRGSDVVPSPHDGLQGAQVAVAPTRRPSPIPPSAPDAPFGAAQGSEEDLSSIVRPTVRPRPTVAPAVAPAGAPGAEDRWLVMLYQDADDRTLEKDIFVDLNEAERIGSDDRVRIVAQMDRYAGGYSGDGDWVSTKRFVLSPDPDLQRVRSLEVDDIGEANMADGATLVDFVTWAVQTFPADKHVLILSDHGLGWPGGWSDPTASRRGGASVPLSSALGDILYLDELDGALGEIRQRTGIDRFELIGLDACLMGHLEVFAALAPHARYAVASQETEPSLGWAYTSFLGDLRRDPAMDGAALGTAIVESYINADQRIVDDQARAEFVGRGSPMAGLFGAPVAPSAAQVTAELERSITLTAADMTKLPALIERLNEFLIALQRVDQRAVAQGRTYAQSFTSIFGSGVPPSYLDLVSFIQIVARQTRDPEVNRTGQAVLDAASEALVAVRRGSGKPGATGLSIYFPSSRLYASAQAGPASYAPIARRFAEASLWDDFLRYHYTGRPFDGSTRSVTVPEDETPPKSPASGGITVSPVRASSQVAAPGQPASLSVDIDGENLGYVKLLVGELDEAANSLRVVDSDYLESEGSRLVDGVFYPDWGEGAFTMEFDWEPYVTAVTDGATDAVGLFVPQQYGASSAGAVYSVDGIYTFVDGERRPARAYFSDGAMVSVFGFTNDEYTGAPREITPSVGDRFTVTEVWLDLDSNANVVAEAREPGQTLTFGSDTLRWTELNAAAGTYVVGFLVEDLDGKQQASYTRIAVR